MDKYCEESILNERRNRIKLIIDIEKDRYEMIKQNVEHGQDYEYFKIIANGIPYDDKAYQEKKSTTYREQFVGETDEQYAEYKIGHDNLFNNIEEKLKKADATFMKNDLKKVIADEFKYRASQGRTNYSMEEVIYIVNEVIDEVAFEGGKE